MSVPPSVSDMLANQVVRGVECIDRMYLNAYVPQLQRELGVVAFFRYHRGHTFASSALMDPISKAFVARIEEFVRKNQVPVVVFKKGQRKDDIAREQRSRFEGDEGVVFVGKAQEKTPVFRTERRRDETGRPYPWIVRSTAMVNHFYFYCLDRDFGPLSLEFCTHFPYTAKLCLNGHEYVKRQLTRKGIAHEALDNAVVSSQDPERLQAPCAGLSGEKRIGLGDHHRQSLHRKTMDHTGSRSPAKPKARCHAPFLTSEKTPSRGAADDARSRASNEAKGPPPTNH